MKDGSNGCWMREMGLDVTAYRRIAPLDLVFVVGEDRRDVAYHAGGFIASVNPDFPGRADDLVDDAAYSFAESFSFSAGRYGDYNDWRERLAEIAGYPAVDGEDTRHRHSRGAWQATGGPFWELINFADNEGDIGSTVSAKLAADFAAHQATIDALLTAGGGRFVAKYAMWRMAFEMASDGGCVRFH